MRGAARPLAALKEASDPAAALKELREATIVQGGGGKKAWSSEETYQEFTAAAKRLRATIDKVSKQAAFNLIESLPAAKASLALLDVAGGLSAAYQQRKKELAALDFDDLLIAARDLLAGPASANCGGVWRRNPSSCWSTSFRTPTRSRWNWCGRCAMAMWPTANCFSWATTSSRSIASAAPIRTSSAACETRYRPRANCR